MKKISVILGLVMMLFLTTNSFAHQAVKTDALVVAENGLKFDSIIISMEPGDKEGAINFALSNPQAKTGERNALDAANTVASLKEQVVKAINGKLDRDPLTAFNPITIEDVAVYGGYNLFSENEFLDSKVFQGSPAGSAYRVKVLLTTKEPTRAGVYTVLQGIFTLYGVK